MKQSRPFMAPLLRLIDQLKEDIRLFIDLIYSFLRFRGYLKRGPIKFFCYRTQNGINLKLRSRVWDSAVVIENWWLNEYLRHYKDIKEEAIIIDIGAHIGAFSLLAAIKIKKSNIFAFEPNPDNFQLLQENIRINHLEKRIFPFQKAVTQKGNTKIKINLHPDNLGMHSMVINYNNLPQNKEKEFFEAETLSLAEIFKENHISDCDLLKIDCEGAEYLILPSAPKEILQRIKKIALEYHLGGDIDKVAQRLKEAEFKIRFPNSLIACLIKVPLLIAWRENIRQA